jgi:hypothetical protein
MGVVQHRDRCKGIRAVHLRVWIEFGRTSFTQKSSLLLTRFFFSFSSLAQFLQNPYRLAS